METQNQPHIDLEAPLTDAQIAKHLAAGTVTGDAIALEAVSRRLAEHMAGDVSGSDIQLLTLHVGWALDALAQAGETLIARFDALGPTAADPDDDDERLGIDPWADMPQQLRDAAAIVRQIGAAR